MRSLCLCLVILMARQERRSEPVRVWGCSYAGGSITQRLLEPEIGLQKGIGRVHEKVSTSSNDAQAYYDQGLAFLYSFDWIHAGRSFNEALRRDSSLAMAYVGLSFALSGLAESDSAEAMEQKARDLARNLTSREKVRIEMRAKQLVAMRTGAPADEQDYVEALDAALKTDPEDLQLLLLRGIAAEGSAYAVGQRGRQESIRWYQRVLELDPDNVAAHHFLVHANEMVGDPIEAAKQAEAYVTLAPNVPHAHHMCGHDLRRTGKLRDAIRQFEQARRLAEDSFSGDPDDLQYDWNYRHNLSLLTAAYQQAGNWRLAEENAAKLFRMPVNNASDDYYRKDLAALFLNRGRFQDALEAAAPLTASKFAVGKTLGQAIAGIADVGLGHLPDASRRLSAAEETVRELPAWGTTISSWVIVLHAVLELDGGDHRHANSELSQLEKDLRARPGADAWSDALFQLELVDHLAVQFKAWDLAQFTAGQLQEHAPDYGGTHWALAQVAQHEGNESVARREIELATKAWSVQ